MSLLAHSGVAAIDLSQHTNSLITSTATILPPYLSGVGGGAYVYTDPATGLTHYIPYGMTMRLPNGVVINGGSGTMPMALPQIDLPTEKREMPVVGYRGWRWETKFRLGLGTRGHLASHAVGPGWRQATETASCETNQPHLAPDPNCGCGLYVMADLDSLNAHVLIDDVMIIGAVLGWGKVVQHGREGWRAQHARILALLDCKLSEAQLKNTRQAAKEYRVAVMEREGLERYVKEWGDPFAEPVTVTQ